MEITNTLSFVNLEGCCYCQGTYINNNNNTTTTTSLSSFSPCPYCSTIPLAREEKVTHVLHGEAGSTNDHTGQMLWPGSIALLRYILYYHSQIVNHSSSDPFSSSSVAQTTISMTSSTTPPSPPRTTTLFHQQSILELGSGCGVISSVLRRLYNCKALLVTDGAKDALVRSYQTILASSSNFYSSSSLSVGDVPPSLSTPSSPIPTGGIPFSWTIPIESLISTSVSSIPPNIEQLMNNISSLSTYSFYLPDTIFVNNNNVDENKTEIPVTTPSTVGILSMFFPVQMIIGAEIIYPSSTFTSLIGLFTSVYHLCRINTSESSVLTGVIATKESSSYFLLSYVPRKPATTLLWLYCAYLCNFHTAAYTLIDWKTYSHVPPLLDAQIILFTCPSHLSPLPVPVMVNSSEPTIEYLLEQYYHCTEFQKFVTILFPNVITQIENYLALQKEISEEEWLPPPPTTMDTNRL